MSEEKAKEMEEQIKFLANRSARGRQRLERQRSVSLEDISNEDAPSFELAKAKLILNPPPTNDDNMDVATVDIEEFDTSEFLIPSQRRKRRQARQLSPPLRTIEVSNKFGAIAPVSNENNNDAPLSHGNQPMEEKRVKQPPIIVNGTILNKNFHGLIQNVTHDFVFQNNASADKVSIVTFSKANSIAIQNILKTRQFQFHTFAGRDERRNTFVLKGLRGGWSCEEVKEAIIAKGIATLNVNIMKNVQSPIYIVSTAKDVTLNVIKEKASVILYTKVSFEKYVNKRQISQCHRCQEWGHVASNCFMQPSCLKCSLPHSTHLCTKPRNSPAKCVNCGGDHPANAVTCPVYIKKLEGLDKRRTQTQARQPTIQPTRTLQPAPPPTTNAWQQRASQAQQTKTNRTSSSRKTDGLSAKMDELAEQFNILDTLVDIDRHIAELKLLNATLRNCTTEFDKAMALRDFQIRINNV
jgi:hypothetical protein